MSNYSLQRQHELMLLNLQRDGKLPEFIERFNSATPEEIRAALAIHREREYFDARSALLESASDYAHAVTTKGTPAAVRRNCKVTLISAVDRWNSIKARADAE